MDIDYVGEGLSDFDIAKRLILAAGGSLGTAYDRSSRGRGKDALDARLAGLNAGTRYGRPVLALRDLDHEECPVAVVSRLLPNRAQTMLLRICVRSADAWLMADREAYARYCGISLRQVPVELETLIRPKEVIEGWIKAGAGRHLREFAEDQMRRVVPIYSIIGRWQANFARHGWEPRRAVDSGRAPSLARALTRLEELVGY